MSERITINGARRSLAHYARTLAGHGIMSAADAGKMRISHLYGATLYVHRHDPEQRKTFHDVPGFCGDSKGVGTSPREAQDLIIQAHNTVNDLYRTAPYNHEAGDAAHKVVMEYYGLWNEYAKMFKVEA